MKKATRKNRRSRLNAEAGPGITPVKAVRATTGSRYHGSCSKPSARPQRHKRRPAADLPKSKTVMRAAGRHDADLRVRPVAALRKTPLSDENMTNLAGEVHDAALGAGRCAKALAEFARTAGQRLAEARAALGDRAFDNWVERTLAIAPLEAMAFIRIAQDAALTTVDVSPARAMALNVAMELVAQLCRHFQP